MARHRGFDIRLAPKVEEQVRELARRHQGEVRQLIGAQDRLAREGTRAPGVKRLSSLDLWEVRAGRTRLYFCPVRGTNQLAVGAMAVKTTKRLRMARLKDIERSVHHWRAELEAAR